jgi:hypothetical protein
VNQGGAVGPAASVRAIDHGSTADLDVRRGLMPSTWCSSRERAAPTKPCLPVDPLITETGNRVDLRGVRPGRRC